MYPTHGRRDHYVICSPHDEVTSECRDAGSAGSLAAGWLVLLTGRLAGIGLKLWLGLPSGGNKTWSLTNTY